MWQLVQGCGFSWTEYQFLGLHLRSSQNCMKIFLVLMFVVIAGYTAVVVANHGLGLFSIFFGDMASLNWPGQFNLDFFCMLLLSGLWTAWRNRFSGVGIALGIVAVLGGAFFLSVYLLYLVSASGGDLRAVLLGEQLHA